MTSKRNIARLSMKGRTTNSNGSTGRGLNKVFVQEKTRMCGLPGVQSDPTRVTNGELATQAIFTADI